MATPANELGDFLRARRAQLSPAALGVAPSRRRRTPGLRREEVAALAGIGVDWYIRLEQGRCVSPSATTVDALARALRLSTTEHAHLRDLTRNAERERFERETVPSELERMLKSLRQPAYIVGRRWDVLAWNRAAEELFAFRALPDEERNTLITLLTKPSSRKLFGAGWADEAKRVVAKFRATYDLWAHDPAFIALHARLHAGCPELAKWWRNHQVSASATGTKLLKHPKLGPVRYTHASFQSNDDPSLRLVIFTPV